MPLVSSNLRAASEVTMLSYTRPPGYVWDILSDQVEDLMRARMT